MAGTPQSQCGGPGIYSSSGSWVPHATTKTGHSQIHIFLTKQLPGMDLGLSGENKKDKNTGHHHSQFLFHHVDVLLRKIYQ